LHEDHCNHDLRAFQRVQINTKNPDIQASLVGNQAAKRNLRAILQCRAWFPQVASVDMLFDASGGRGISPADWPQAVNTTFCGYAGGLSPENVAQAVQIIGTRANRYWIDMESGVRDERDRFSLEKCRAVCEAVYGRPIGAKS
jgi:phosphoribosylanthranilate isomerase